MPYAFQQVTTTLVVPSTASTTTVGAAFSVTPKFNYMGLIANLVGHTGGTLDVYLQDSPDGGTTWFDCVHFTQLAAGVSRVERAGVQASGGTLATIGQGTLAAPGVALAAGSVAGGPWASLMRLVAVTGSGTSGVDRTQTVRFFLQEDQA